MCNYKQTLKAPSAVECQENKDEGYSLDPFATYTTSEVACGDSVSGQDQKKLDFLCEVNKQIFGAWFTALAWILLLSGIMLLCVGICVQAQLKRKYAEELAALDI